MEMLKKIESGERTLEIYYDENPYNPFYMDLNYPVHFYTWHRYYQIGNEHSYDTKDEFLKDLALELATEEDIKEISNRHFRSKEIKYNDETDTWEVVVNGENINMYGQGYETEEEAKEAMKEYIEMFKNDEWVYYQTDEQLLDLISKHAIILDVYMYDHTLVSFSTSPFSCRWDSGHLGYIFVKHTDIEPPVTKEKIDNIKKEIEHALKKYECYFNGEVYKAIIKTDGLEDEVVYTDLYPDDLTELEAEFLKTTSKEIISLI